MTTRDKVLGFFEMNKGESISGEKLADALNISRNAVWKAVNALRREGFLFDSSPGRGYSLLKENEKLSAQSITKHLKKLSMFKIFVFDTLPSTNDHIKKAAESGEHEGLVAIANEQSGGKGRMGRSFFSPAGSGIYLSILLRPKLPASEALLITTAAAVSVAKAIEETTGTSAQIKWVNDIFIEGKKVCGILTEASLDFESGGITYAVLGIGINLSDPPGGYPDKLSETAASIFANNKYPLETKQRLIAAILDNFSVYYKALALKEYMSEYRERSCIIGKDIFVFSGDSKREAQALSIDDDAALVVKYINGEIGRLSSGEISIKVKSDEQGK